MRDCKGPIPSREQLGFLRQHQEEGYYRATAIADREIGDKVTVLYAAPGAGKSLFASIFAHVLILSGFVDRVVIVVPRDSLREQMEKDSFCRPERGLTLKVGASVSDVSKRSIFSSAGYVTTYQAVATRAGAKHVKAVQGLRTLVVLDEIHHLVDEEGRGWVPGVKALVDGATHVLAMSGGLGRDDEKRIPFIPYDDTNAPVKHINYSRKDALNERAIVPLRIDMLDGDTEYFHKGRDHAVTLSDASSRKEKLARRTALSLDEYRYKLLAQAYEAWLDYRDNHGSHSQLIVICDSQADARNAERWLRERASGREIALAISDEGAKAAGALKRFRERFEKQSGPDILVTCRMAYEGLDAPAATHMAYLSRIRSVPWMDQAFARITRFNPKSGAPWERQGAYAFAPCDQSMKAYVAKLHEEQDDRCREQLARVGASRYARRSDFAALRADPTQITIGGEHGIAPPEVQEVMRNLRADHPFLQNVPAIDLEKLAKQFVEKSGGRTP